MQTDLPLPGITRQSANMPILTPELLEFLSIDIPTQIVIIHLMFVDKAQAFPRRPRPPQTTGLVFVVA